MWAGRRGHRGPGREDGGQPKGLRQPPREPESPRDAPGLNRDRHLLRAAGRPAAPGDRGCAVDKGPRHEERPLARPQDNPLRTEQGGGRPDDRVRHQKLLADCPRWEVCRYVYIKRRSTHTGAIKKVKKEVQGTTVCLGASCQLPAGSCQLYCRMKRPLLPPPPCQPLSQLFPLPIFNEPFKPCVLSLPVLSHLTATRAQLMRLCHEINIFGRPIKSNHAVPILSVWVPMVFKYSDCLVEENNKYKDFACFCLLNTYEF